MISRDDKRAALVLLGLAAMGLVVRLVLGGAAVPGEVMYRAADSVVPQRDSLAAQAARLATPLAAGERIDIDVASAVELTRLPRIGPGLATRIVADREANGPFGSLEELDRVSGVGPALIETVGPFAAFSGRPTEKGAGSPTRRLRINTASLEQLAQLPGIGAKRARAIVEDRSNHGRYRSLDDLSRVRGIGSATLERLRPLVVVP